MSAPQTHRVQVLVAGKPVSAPAIRHDPQSFQQELHEARARFGSALCECQNPALKLVVRERTGKLFLAAWPDQAAKHALDCPFFSERRAGAQEYGAGAIEPDGELTHIALYHPARQERLPARHLDTIEHRGPGPSGQRKDKLHLWGLLHYLWEEAGLSRWHPGWHRDWGFARYLIRRVAQTTMVEGQELLKSLYVPPIWSEKRKAEIQSHWQQFIAPLLANHRRSPRVASAFVIGIVRGLDPSEFGHVLRLHHHSERFFLDHTVSDMLARYSRRGWAAAKRLEVPHEENEKPYVIAAMRIEASHTGRMTVVEAALMRVSPRFIPVNSSYEDKLARTLVDGDRKFVRPLQYDNHALALPEFVLKDALDVRTPDGQPTHEVALYVYRAAVPAAQKLRLEAADRDWAARNGLAYWQWDALKTPLMPRLPDAQRAIRGDAPSGNLTTGVFQGPRWTSDLQKRDGVTSAIDRPPGQADLTSV